MLLQTYDQIIYWKIAKFPQKLYKNFILKKLCLSSNIVASIQVLQSCGSKLAFWNYLIIIPIANFWFSSLDQSFSKKFPDENAANCVAVLHQPEQMLASLRSGHHFISRKKIQKHFWKRISQMFAHLKNWLLLKLERFCEYFWKFSELLKSAKNK